MKKKEQKRVTIDSSQPQASFFFFFFFFLYGQPIQPLPLVKPYHGTPSPPSQPMSHYTSMASASPLPKSPEPGSPKGSVSHDILAKILERLDGMDTKLAQLNRVQSSLTKLTAEVSTMSTKVLGMEKQLTDREASRNFDTNTRFRKNRLK